MVNWEQPQKQSAVGIFLFAAKAFREVIAFMVIAIGGLSRKGKPAAAWMLTIGGFAAFIFGRAALEYFYFKFYISEGQFIVKKGILSKKTIMIPFDRIQSVQLEQNLFHRIIHHYKVSIDTAGSEKTEVSIHALTYNKALDLKRVLTGEKTVAAGTEAGAAENTIRLSAKDLFKLALSHNHLETVGLIIAFVLARFHDIKEWFDIDAYGWLESHGKQVAVTTQIIAISAFIALAFAILISVVRIILKYSDLMITLSEKGFNVKHGLLHSHQQFIGANKIQFIQWNANWARRKIGMYMFHVKTTGENDIKNKKRVRVPVTRKEHIYKLAAYYQQELPSAGNSSNDIQPQYVSRKTLFVGLPVTLFFILVFFFIMKWQALWFGLLLIYSFVRNRIFRKNFRFWVKEDAIEISSGVWGRQRIILNWHKLQVVTINQGIYKRRKNLADLLLQTASGNVVLPYITLAQAQVLSDYAAMKTESTQKRWM
jgi:putative membrane protein